MTPSLALLLPGEAKVEIRPEFQLSFRIMLENIQYYLKVPPKRFHLNGHIIGFCP